MSYISSKMKRYNNLMSEITSVYHDASLKMGLSDSSMQILYTICNFGDNCLLSDICHFSGLSKQTINSAIRKLESDEILYLKQETPRTKRVFLSKKGKELAKNTAFKIINIENSIFDSWSDKEVDKYIELTQRFLNSLRENTDSLEEKH